MKLRVAWGILLFRVGLRRVLPRDAVSAMPVVESGEPLVDIVKNDRLLLRPFSANSPMRARQSVVGLLYQAVELLPSDLKLVVVEAYRTTSYQEQRWAHRVEEMTNRLHGATKEEVERVAIRYTARASGSGSGHQTGGAFDVTLADSSGVELDLGTKVKEASALSAVQAHGLSASQRELRNVLLKAMVAAGFVNYPLEWWHFSYGDRLWAAYSGRSVAVYDVVPSH